MPLPCLKPRRSSKVCPAPNSSLDVDLVEVRKGRLLRIQHINPRLRNKHVPQSKHGKTQAAPLELHVPKVSFYGNKCVVTDAATQNSNHVKKAGSGPSPNNNRVPPAHNSNIARCVKSNHFPSNLSKEQKRMLFKMGVRSVSALKNIVLFFFHGVGGSSDIWQTQINYFSSLGFEIVAPDLIGHGMSEVPLKKRAYHFREILADIIAIFDRYCKKKNLVIGHSYGCAFTTVLARERARRVWRLIMISGGGPIPLAPEIGIFAFPLWFVSCIRPCLDQVFEKSAFKKKQKNEMLKRASFNIPSFVLHYIINGQDWPEGDEVYHSWISVPTLLINGRDDNFATLDDAKLMKATIHGSKLEIVDEASHMVMLEAPDKVNKLILDFICSRGSHKLPDVKESAEEGHESPMRLTQACSYSVGGDNGGGGGGGGGGGKLIHPLYLPQNKHQHYHDYRAQGVRSGTPNRSPSPKIMLNQPDILNDSQTPVMMLPEESLNLTQPPEVDMYAPTYDNMASWLKIEHRSSYDNASYESDESSEEYYYYRDQYGNHHYVSAKEYARQFPNSQTPPGESRASDINMDVSTVEIPAFEDISLDQSTPMDETLTEEDSTSDYNSVNGYPGELDANYPVDFNDDDSPGYMVSRERQYSNSQCESMEENVVYERSGNVDVVSDNPSSAYSIPELQFCEECIRNGNTERTTNCEKCIELNLVPLEYRTQQTTSCTRRQSVTLALGRQRSDSLDYLGQEQLIIITCYDPAEEEKISISSSVDDTHGGPRHRSKNQATNQNATRRNQRSSPTESEEIIHRKSPSLPTLNEQQEECSPRSVPAKKGKLHKEDLFRSLHSELLAKVNKRNSLTKSGTTPEIEKKRADANISLGTEPASDEGIVSRKNSFLESKKLMEQHFAKTAFKIPALPSSRGSSPCEGPTNKKPPKPLGPKPQRRKYSPAQLKQEQSEVMAESSPSFLQSKRTIHEHFSKIGLGSPMTRPYSSPNLSSFRPSSHINGASPQRESQPSIPSSPTLTKTLTKSEEILTPDRKKSIEDGSSSRRLSITEWAQRHIRRVTELASPENSVVSEETTESANSVSRSTTCESDSPVSSSLSVRDWAERHLKRIAGSVSPTSSPSLTRPEPKAEPETELEAEPEPEVEENISPRRSSTKEIVDDATSATKTSLSLSDWAERHLKIVAGKIHPPSPVSVQNDTNLLRVSPEKELPKQEADTPLTLDNWAKRHLQIIAERSKPIEHEKGFIDPGTKETSDQGTTEKEKVPLETRETQSLSITEWAERHVRKTREINLSSPKPSYAKLEDSESRKEISVVQTPGKIAQNLGKTSSNILNEWAERHVRRIAEQKLVVDMDKDGSCTEAGSSDHLKQEMVSATEMSVNSHEESKSSSVYADLRDTATDTKNKNSSTACDAEAAGEGNKDGSENHDKKTEDNRALDVSTSNPNFNLNPPGADEKHGNENEANKRESTCAVDVSVSNPNSNPNPSGTSDEKHSSGNKDTKTEDKCAQNVSKSNPDSNPNPNLPVSGSSETGISTDRYLDKGQLSERKKETLRGNANDNETPKAICVPDQSHVAEKCNMPFCEASLLNKPTTNLLKQADKISDVNIDDTQIGASKIINEKEGNNRELSVCTPTKLQTTLEGKYLLHRKSLNKPPLNEGSNLRLDERATEGGENKTLMIEKDGSENKKTEIDRSQNVGVLVVRQIGQESVSSDDGSCRNEPFEASELTTERESKFTLSHETAIDSTSLEELQRTLHQRMRSSSSALSPSRVKAHLPPGHGEDSNNNNNNNNNNDNRNNTNNKGKQGAISDVRPTEPTIDDNSNVVASTSVPHKSSQNSLDKGQSSDEKQTGSGCQTGDIPTPTDNENNRILSDSTLGTSTETDTRAMANISNRMSNTNTTTSKN